MFCPLTALCWWEKTIGSDGYHDALSSDLCKCFGHSTTLTTYVLAIHAVQQIIIRVGIKTTLHQLLALIALVASSARSKQTIIVGLVLREVVSIETAVRDQGYSASGFQSLASAVQTLACTESRVCLHGHTLHFHPCAQPWRYAWCSSDECSTLNHIALHDCPFQGVETTNRTTYQ